MVSIYERGHICNHCFNEPFTASPCWNLSWGMHCLIFETSIWLLVGSTRFATLCQDHACPTCRVGLPMFCLTQMCCSTVFQQGKQNGVSIPTPLNNTALWNEWTLVCISLATASHVRCSFHGMQEADPLQNLPIRRRLECCNHCKYCTQYICKTPLKQAEHCSALVDVREVWLNAFVNKCRGSLSELACSSTLSCFVTTRLIHNHGHHSIDSCTKKVSKPAMPPVKTKKVVKKISKRKASK